MRNTILFMVMALLYAYGSEQDYQDATLVQAYAPALQAEARCRAAGLEPMREGSIVCFRTVR